jgi:hypothetical protein
MSPAGWYSLGLVSSCSCARPRLAPLVNREMLRTLVHDVNQDRPIWEHRQDLERPRLIDGDGPIGRYRAWAEQFSA